MPQGLCDYFKNGVSQAIGLMKTLPECERFVKIFQNLLEKIIPEGIETSKPIPENVDGFFVLNHGDFWIQNMMFKYDRNGHPIDVLLVKET